MMFSFTKKHTHTRTHVQTHTVHVSKLSLLVEHMATMHPPTQQTNETYVEHIFVHMWSIYTHTHVHIQYEEVKYKQGQEVYYVHINVDLALGTIRTSERSFMMFKHNNSQ